MTKLVLLIVAMVLLSACSQEPREITTLAEAKTKSIHFSILQHNEKTGHWKIMPMGGRTCASYVTNPNEYSDFSPCRPYVLQSEQEIKAKFNEIQQEEFSNFLEEQKARKIHEAWRTIK